MSIVPSAESALWRYLRGVLKLEDDAPNPSVTSSGDLVTFRWLDGYGRIPGVLVEVDFGKRVVRVVQHGLHASVAGIDDGLGVRGIGFYLKSMWHNLSRMQAAS